MKRTLMRHLIVMICLLLLMACDEHKKQEKVVADISQGQDSIQIPRITIIATDKNIVNRDNKLYYKDSLFSGFITILSADKRLLGLSGYWQGKLEGAQKQWYDNGQIRELRVYTANKKTGVHKGWWDNGVTRFEYFFKDDIPIGRHYQWYQSGKLYSLFEYNKEGQPEGAQQLWYEDGSVKSNYVVRNNRRYGFLGAKGCEIQVIK